jgi:hypothetical protein
MKVAMLTIPLWFVVTISCANKGPAETVDAKGLEIIGICQKELKRIEGGPIDSDADQAYVYMDEIGALVNFTHGALGTFGDRSADYGVVLMCEVVAGSPPTVTFMGRPLKDPIVDVPGKTRSSTSVVGTTEILFQRVNGDFRFCCSQPYDEGNLGKHNPNFPWHEASGGVSWFVPTATTSSNRAGV